MTAAAQLPPKKPPFRLADLITPDEPKKIPALYRIHTYRFGTVEVRAELATDEQAKLLHAILQEHIKALDLKAEAFLSGGLEV